MSPMHRAMSLDVRSKDAESSHTLSYVHMSATITNSETEVTLDIQYSLCCEPRPISPQSLPHPHHASAESAKTNKQKKGLIHII